MDSDATPSALARTMARVELAREQGQVEQPVFFSACVTDGKRLWAVRYSSNDQSRTLYHSKHMHALRVLHGAYESRPAGGVVVVSEPLDELTEHWEAVPESSLLVVEDGAIAIASFSPK